LGQPASKISYAQLASSSAIHRASQPASQPDSQPASQPASQLPRLQIASILIKTCSLSGVLKQGRKGMDQERRRTLINTMALINELV